MQLIVEDLGAARRYVEVVERKGIGHPDTLCDALADNFERSLSRFYRDHFGRIFHHNVDKALLIGGASRPRFGGGTVDEPIEIILAGRATGQVDGKVVPVDEIAERSVWDWLDKHLHALDAERHVTIRCAVRGGSAELSGLFSRTADRPLANDTSIGVGFWPLSPLERDVAAIEMDLNGAACKRDHPELGEDVKVLGCRVGDARSFTVGCALVDRHVPSLDAYLASKELVADRVRAVAGEVEVAVNAADDPASGQIFLTVTGTSAEAGDDGEVGRGNRGNGLITPFRLMTLEAVAGKNPVNHVGKLYNVAATRLARSIVDGVPDVTKTEVCMVSRIGAPVDDPPVLWIGAGSRGRPLADLEAEIAEIARAELAALPSLWERLVDSADAYW